MEYGLNVILIDLSLSVKKFAFDNKINYHCYVYDLFFCKKLSDIKSWKSINKTVPILTAHD